MERPVLLWLSGNGRRYECHARSGTIRFREGEPPVIVLRDGEAWVEQDGRRERVQAGSDISVTLEIEGLDRRQRGPKDMSSAEIRDYIPNAPSKRKKAEARTEYYRRLSGTLSPLFLVLLCVPIGILTRKASRMAGMGAALPPFLLFLVFALLGQGLGERGRVSAAFGAWMADAALALAAVPLLWRVARR
jgi:lipopolysaccharide export LptBFGC system permease protein LptF